MRADAGRELELGLRQIPGVAYVGYDGWPARLVELLLTPEASALDVAVRARALVDRWLDETVDVRIVGSGEGGRDR